MITPVESPMRPAPAIAAVETDSEADAERKVWAAIPDAGIRVPSGPGDNRTAVNQPGIISRNVNYLGVSRLNGNGGVLIRYGLLRRGFKIAGLFRSLAHHLNGVHHILFLVVVGVSERGGPGEVFVHVAKDRGKSGKGLDAGVPGLLVHRLTQGIALKTGMRLYPTIRLDDLLGKGGSRQDLRNQRVRIESDRGNQLLQLVGRLWGVWNTLGGLRGILGVLGGREILRPRREQEREGEEGKRKISGSLRIQAGWSALDSGHVLISLQIVVP